MSDSLKGKALTGVIWSSIDKFSVQGIQFIIMLIMARLLSPSDYGLIGMLAVFIAVANSIVDSGFANALIRKQNRTDVDFSTSFYFNFVVGIVLYFVLFLVAPYIASFYNAPELVSVTRVLGLNLIINSLTIVQRAIFMIRVDFKTQSKASVTSVIISGIVGITLAYKGFGVWSLVVQTLLNSFINMFLLWVLSKWKPRREFSLDSFLNLFSFGSKLMISSVIDTLYKNIFTIVIGKKFLATDLGYYTRADQFVQMPSSNFTSIMQRVTYPILSSIQDDTIRLRSAYLRFLRISGYIIFPLMIGLAVLAYPVILFLLTDKWLFSAKLLQILCLSAMWYPIHAINLNLLQVKGKSNLFLRLEIIKKSVGIGILCITIPLGIVAMCIGSVISSLICLVINTYYTGIIINLGFIKQMKVLIPSLFYSFSMGVLIYFIIGYIHTPTIQLVVGLLLGGAYYLGISYVTKSRDLKEIVVLVKSKIRKK